jgi:hypothetical protein
MTVKGLKEFEKSVATFLYFMADGTTGMPDRKG